MKEDLLWVEKYRPKRVADVVGNEEAKAAFVDWLQSKRRKKKAVLLYGPPGVGKTTLVNAVAKEFNFIVIEMNASDTRTEKAVKAVASPATSFMALDMFSRESKGNILFMDEVDGIAGNEDRGGVSAIIKIVEQARTPVIMAANDPDLQKLRPLKKVCVLIRFQQVRIPLIIVTLRSICKQEGIEAEFEALEMIAQNSRGDMRSAINDLQSIAEKGKTLTAQDTTVLGIRNKDTNMDETLRGYFSAKSVEEASRLLSSSNANYDDLLMAIGDNLPLRYSDPEELARAYDFISQADVYRGRVGVEYWHLLRYFFNCLALAAGVSPETYKPFTLISPPIRVITLFWSKGKRTTLANICGKIGHQCHVSKQTAKEEFIPFLKIMLEKLEKQEAESLMTWLELEPEEVDFVRKMKKF
ncbi:MAG: replication factor C large subunit [Candidatus Bathyarchaeota archaeon]|nr:replication factor C large subunit [Candidatus Bathyarchaeota archaeon]